MKPQQLHKNYNQNLKAPLPGFEHISRYWDTKHHVVAARLHPGDYYITEHEEMLHTVLGSCVSACLFDGVRGIGGMNHFLLPIDSVEEKTAQSYMFNATEYGQEAMRALIDDLLANGASAENLKVKLFGGGHIIDIDSIDVGRKNIEFAQSFVSEMNLPVVASDLGGCYPRKVLFFPKTGRVRVKPLRKSLELSVAKEEVHFYETMVNHEFQGTIYQART